MSSFPQQICSLLIPAAICYDFDGTLAPGCMMDETFIPQCGLTPQEFWRRSNQMARDKGMDNILAYMWQMRSEMKTREKQITRDMLFQCGAGVRFFPGVETWFPRINAYAADKGVLLEHYVISSGLREMVLGTKIAPFLKEVFAADFIYDAAGEALWPALSVNYTNKTQFLFRINKGCLDLGDHQTVNEHMDDKDKPMPFRHMIYIGDGETDVPSMKIVRQEGGACYCGISE